VRFDSPNENTQKKRVTKVKRRGKIVSEKIETLDDNGKVIKTEIRKVD